MQPLRNAWRSLIFAPHLTPTPHFQWVDVAKGLDAVLPKDYDIQRGGALLRELAPLIIDENGQVDEESKTRPIVS